MTIGDRIKQRRTELQLSQDDLAKKVGYKSRSSIQKIESARNLPITKVAKMATALDCSPGYLMGWEDNIEEDIKDRLITASIHGDKIKQLAEAYDRADPRTKALVDMALGILPPDAVLPHSTTDNT